MSMPVFRENGSPITSFMPSLVNRAAVFIKRSGEPIENRRSFYWRLHYYCSAQMINRSESFFLPAGGDPNESQAVIRVIQEITNNLSISECSADQRCEFYTDLLDMLLAEAKTY